MFGGLREAAASQQARAGAVVLTLQGNAAGRSARGCLVMAC